LYCDGSIGLREFTTSNLCFPSPSGRRWLKAG
jgi:hypothetical protein